SINVEPAPVNCCATAIWGPTARAPSASAVTDSATVRRRVTRCIATFSLLEISLQLDAERVRVRVRQQPVGHQVILTGQAELAGEVLVPADAGPAPIVVRGILVRIEDVVPHEEISALAGVVGDLS